MNYACMPDGRATRVGQARDYAQKFAFSRPQLALSSGIWLQRETLFRPDFLARYRALSA